MGRCYVSLERVFDGKKEEELGLALAVGTSSCSLPGALLMMADR